MGGCCSKRTVPAVLEKPEERTRLPSPEPEPAVHENSEEKKRQKAAVTAAADQLAETLERVAAERELLKNWKKNYESQLNEQLAEKEAELKSQKLESQLELEQSTARAISEQKKWFEKREMEKKEKKRKKKKALEAEREAKTNELISERDELIFRLKNAMKQIAFLLKQTEYLKSQVKQQRTPESCSEDVDLWCIYMRHNCILCLRSFKQQNQNQSEFFQYSVRPDTCCDYLGLGAVAHDRTKCVVCHRCDMSDCPILN